MATMEKETSNSEILIYKHITKLPWIAVLLYTILFSWIFNFGSVDFIDKFVRLLIFGFGWWLIFEGIDQFIVVKYRTKILARDPDIKRHMILNKVSEIEM